MKQIVDADKSIIELVRRDTIYVLTCYPKRYLCSYMLSEMIIGYRIDFDSFSCPTLFKMNLYLTLLEDKYEIVYGWSDTYPYPS